MSVRAVFFDMDDTLLDGHTAMEASWTLVCGEASAGFGCEADDLRAAIRREAMDFWQDEAKVEHWRIRLDDARTEIIRRALRAQGLDEARAERMSYDYADAHRQHLLLFDDAIETLERIRASGRRVGLLTNGPAKMQRDKIDRFNLARHFDVVVVEGEFGHGKPHPEVFRHALEAVDAEPADAWHVGDNLYADVGGARSAGLRAAWIHRDRLKLDEKVPHKPDAAIAHLHEIDEALGLNGHH